MITITKKFRLVVLLISLVLSIAGCGSNEKTTEGSKGTSKGEYTIRLGASQPADHPMTTTMNKFKELVEKESDGRIKVEVYPANQLGSQAEMNEGVQSGTVTMTYSSIAYMGGSYNPNYNSLLLPFLVTKGNIVKAYAALDGEIGKELADQMSKVGILPLGYGPIGFRHITNSKHPVKSPDDLNGLKIRLQPNDVHIQTFKMMGANPTAMDFSEVYSGLQQHVIDGQENPIDIIYTNKFYEVQDYLSLTGHFYDYAGLWMNKEFYDQLPADLQKIVSESGLEAVKFHRDLYTEKESQFLELLKKEGTKVYEPSEGEIKQFQEKSAPVYDQFLKQAQGKEFTEKVWKAVGK
ncbi:TRAP transporter substrate-binding protein [Aeromicrobium ponti]|uniref:Tripartite ATP-independent transporter DctP family solute receptor n=1 Tax=Cytobacillus oceanisediminis TaxID=665099 RepID=A0A562JRI9_9BACI|nr:TRAP transporter substrate-binding protein [Cytobacillus oceanisediminis]TWH85776.1 tripartite ATP-independent transporter DctP family solute receptor [Cytobacillus oceanisediminis]